MAKTMNFFTTVQYGGQSYGQLVSAVGDNDSSSQPAAGVAAAKTGALTTRTDATSGTLTMDVGHGFTTGAVISLFWSGGSRHNVTLGTVSVNSCPFSGGAGDDLPAASTAITAMVPAVELVAFDGAAATAALAYWQPQPTDGAAYVEFLKSDDTLITTFSLSVASPASSWDGTGTNPFGTDAVGKVRFSHGQTSARVMGETCLYN